MTNRRSRRSTLFKIAALLTVILAIWVSHDLFAPRTAHLRNFDPDEVGKLETEMWRSYHERSQLELEWWIIHRERERHEPGDLARALAELQAEVYQLPVERLLEHDDPANQTLPPSCSNTLPMRNVGSDSPSGVCSFIGSSTT